MLAICNHQTDWHYLKVIPYISSWRAFTVLVGSVATTKRLNSTRRALKKTDLCSELSWLPKYNKGKDVFLESRYPCDCTCSSDFTSPGSGHTAASSYWPNLWSVHQVPITVAVWNMKFAWHFYTWPELGIEPQTFWSWVQCPIHMATCSQRHVSLYPVLPYKEFSLPF